MMNDIHKQVDRVEALYEAGDYKEARALAAKLLPLQSLEAGERDRLKRVLSATATDSVVVMAIGFTFFLLLFLVLKYAF